MRRGTRCAASVTAVLLCAALLTQIAPTPARAATPSGRLSPTAMAEWLTTGDQASLLAPQPALPFGARLSTGAQTIAVNDTTRYQTLTGFGAALTDSSAWLLSQLPPPTLQATLASLFGPGGLSIVRVPLGASDFVVGAPYTYDDVAAGAIDPGLADFSIGRDATYLIPLLHAIREINPAVQIVAEPWSAPAWMKTGDSLFGGSLNPTWAATYAQYLVRTLDAYAAAGVAINTLVVQDEPEFSPGDYPGMTLTEAQEASFISQDLGPAMRSAGQDSALLGYDDNWNDTTYPTSLLANRSAASYLAGVGFHCYDGAVTAQTTVHNRDPKAAIWLTECAGGSWSAGFASDLVWETRNLFVGGTRNWATAVLWWNLALDQSGGPHTGGCTDCRGVLTVDPTTGTVTPNVEYWALAQASVATEPGAVRVASTTLGNGNLETTAFRNPNGTDSLLVVNSGTTPRTLQVRDGSLSAPTTLAGGAVATFSW